MNFQSTMQYLTPTTLEAMYRDLDEARLDLLATVNEDNLISKAKTYRVLTNKTIEISDKYEELTGLQLWAEVHAIK